MRSPANELGTLPARAPAPVTVEVAYRSPGAFLVAYATNLARGSLFVETAAPLATGTPVALRLQAPPAAPVIADGVVTWTRGAAAGPGQPAGMGVALTTPPEALGATIDGLAFGFGGIQVLLGTGEPAPRAILTRYLRSILSCEIVDVDYGEDVDVKLEGLDLAIVDLDSSGPQGFDLYERVRAHARAGSAPVLALAQLERERTRALRMGFEEAITNPPVFAELQAAVLRCLAKPVVATPATG